MKCWAIKYRTSNESAFVCGDRGFYLLFRTRKAARNKVKLLKHGLGKVPRGQGYTEAKVNVQLEEI